MTNATQVCEGITKQAVACMRKMQQQSHMSADGLSGGLVVAGDYYDADAGHAAGLHGGRHLRPWRVMHAHHSQQRQVMLVIRCHLHRVMCCHMADLQYMLCRHC